MDFCFMGDSHFTANLFEDFAVEIVSSIHEERPTHAVKLNAMCNFMFKHKAEKAKGCQGFFRQFDFLFPRVSLSQTPPFQLHKNNLIVNKSILFQGEAGVLFNFGGGQRHGATMG
jgi:hypothetical protein